jgi:AbiU2
MSTKTDAKSLIKFLDNEIALLKSVYSTYARLFNSDSDTRKLLSDSDAAFFADLYIVYLNYISVAVSRLLDPKETKTRKEIKSNLTIFTLIDTLKSAGHSEAEKLHQRLLDIKKRAYNFTDPRNQLVAHLDYKTHNKEPDKKPIPSFTKSEFENFYKDTGQLMNDIRTILGMPPFMYDWPIFGHGCGRKLIHRLKTASDHMASRASKKP